jgi:hypothetical protein
MAFITADRVLDSSTSTGTGAFVVSGTPAAGYRTFSAVMSVNDTCYYSIQGQTTSEWEVGLGTYSSANTLTRTTVYSSSNSGSAVTFSAGTKNVFITMVASKSVQVDPSGSTTSAVNSISNGTSNVSIASSNGAVTATTNGSTALTIDTSQNATLVGNMAMGSSFLRNRIINGNIQIWQKGTSFTGLTASLVTADRMFFNIGTPGTGVFKVERVTDTPTGQGFPYSMKWSPTTAMSSVGAATYCAMGQGIEGLNISDLAYGTANAQTITISFWIKSNITGIVPFALIQSGASTARSYASYYTINTAGTWQKITITIPGDTGGTIPNTNAIAFELDLCYMAIGSSYTNGTFNTWNVNSAGNQYLPSGQTYINRASSTSNYVSITGVQLEVGTIATPYEYQIYSNQLAQCQRYYRGSTSVWVGTSGAQSTIYTWGMRRSPSISGGGTGFTISNQTVDTTTCYQTTAANQTLAFDSEF